MNEKKHMAVLLLLLVFLLAGCTPGNPNAAFNGSRTSDDDQFQMEFSILNASDSAVLTLDEGDALVVEIVRESGRLDIRVQKDDETPIYRADDAESGEFSLWIESGGDYTITVTGEKARGSVRFIREANDGAPSGQ